MTAVFIFIASLTIFAVLAVYFSIREERAKKLLQTREKELNRRLYEISILKEIADRIGYSLDVPKIIDIITGSLRNLFPYSTASSILTSEDKLYFKTYVEEKISHVFIDTVRARMLESLKALYDKPLPENINESLSGVVLDDTNQHGLASFFNIPLVINDKVVGLINVSSQKSGLYKEEEMTILYRITKQASQAVSKLAEILQTEKGKLLAMISSLADGVFMVDVDTKLAVINPKALVMLSIDKPTPTIFDVVDRLTGKLDLRTKIEQALKTDKLVVIPELTLSDSLILQILITPVVDKDGRVLGAAVLLHDITAEKSLAQMKEDFTNMIVHELRAPLTAIKQAASLLLQDEASIKEQEREKFLKMIQESSNTLLSEVSDMLDAAKLEAGRFTINPLLGDIAQIIQERIEFFMPLAKNKNITLTAKIEPNLPEIYFDKIRLAQVLNNLLSNAVKFTKQGDTIEVRAYEKDGEIAISISDTGIGIPKEKQYQLFSKFSQLHELDGGTGTGLGLYITRGIVEAHGGKIDVQSELGRGTTVTFTIPEKPTLLN